MEENRGLPQKPIRPNGSSSWSGDAPAEFHSQTVGDRGPVLEQDSILHETLETFIHTKILERPVHVKGYGAFGYFQTVNSMTPYTKLHFLQKNLASKSLSRSDFPLL